MKNFIKKTIVGLFTFAILFVAQNAFAAIWNGASNDCNSISIVNATTNQGYQNPCWPLSTVQADKGEVLNVRIYYHNTGSVTATNTKIIVSPSVSLSTEGNTKQFTGRIVSDQGSLSFGPVKANISSSQSLTFLSAKWYTNNTSETLTPLLAGQTGSEVLTDNGLVIGSIASGWATQGSVVVAFRISNNTVTPPVENNCSINSFYASPTSITSGNSSTLNWSTSNCNSATISNLSYNVPVSGTQSVWPTYTTTYTLSATGSTGGTQTRSVTVSVNQINNDNCSINSFYANPTSIVRGNSSNLYWSTNDCTSATISNTNYNVAVSGSQRVYPTNTTTYTLRARGPNGVEYTRSITVYVEDENINNDNCSINSFYANPTSIMRGNSSNLYWSTNDCTSATISNTNYNVAVSGSQRVYPTNTTTYTLRARGSNGVEYTRSITVYVNEATIITPPIIVLNKNVVTTPATNIGRNNAQVNGYITNSNYYNSNIHFEYGTTVNLGLRTATKNVNGNSTFNEVLTGLNTNTIYFFQAVSDGNEGISKGNIEIFKTLDDGTNGTNGTIRPVIIQGTTVIGTASPIELSIENRYELIGEGDLIDYIVKYKNIGKTRLVKPMVQVILPSNVTLINASRGSYSVDTHTLSAPLLDLAKGEEGVIYLQARVDSIPLNNAQIVSTAILVYTNTNGAQENAMAYVLNRPKIMFTNINSDLTIENGSVLGGAALFGGLLSISFLGWLLILLIILLLILIIRSYSKNYRKENNSPTPTH